MLPLAQDTSMVKVCSECACRRWSLTWSHAWFSQLSSSKANNGFRFPSFFTHRICYIIYMESSMLCCEGCDWQWLKVGTSSRESRDLSMYMPLLSMCTCIHVRCLSVHCFGAHWYNCNSTDLFFAVTILWKSYLRNGFVSMCIATWPVEWNVLSFTNFTYNLYHVDR